MITDLFHSILRSFRAAFRNKGLTLINITGLSVGLAVAMFLLVYLNFEFSYDKHYKDADRIYRTLCVWEEGGNVENYPICFWNLADELRRDVPEVEVVSRLFRSSSLVSVKEDSEKINFGVYMVDSCFMSIFNFDVVYGETEHALEAPNQCVITRSVAERLFGAGVNPISSQLVADEKIYHVSTVIEDLPENTHLNFDILIKLPNFGWGGLEYFTYLKLRPGVNHETAIAKCNVINANMLEASFSGEGKSFGSITEPLTELHTSTQASMDLSPKANKGNLFFIVLVVIFILGIAICNFISLYIIQGEKRATEISVRKTNGAVRGSVIRMLFGETFLVTLLAFLLAIVLYYSFAVSFAGLINFNMPDDIGITSTMWINFILLFVVIALFAGGYPAYTLSRFSPADLIRKSTVRKYRLTAASVVVQFSIVIFCVSALLIVSRQLDYVKKLPLGYDADDVLTVSMGVTVSNTQFESYRAELMKYPEIVSVGLGQGHPASGHSGQGIRKPGQDEKQDMSIDERRVGSGYFETYRIPIVSGRGFSENLVADSNHLILSETAAKMLGIDEAIGQKLLFVGDGEFTLIGIAKDIHSASAHDKIGPLAYSAYARRSGTFAVRFQKGTYEQAKTHLLSVLDKRLKGIPMAVVLMKDRVLQKYSQDDVTARILTSGTMIAIVLALLGLLALSSFVAQQKRKEISVRRVLGAQVGEIVYDLNRFIILRILPAVPIGIALSWYAMHRWLSGFAYSITMVWWIFALALLITLAVALLTVLYQSLRAATANPVDALKSE